RMGCAIPSDDPYLLLALSDASGYHDMALRWRKVSTVGQGWTASDRLTAQIKQANEKESLHSVLMSFSDDVEVYGNGFLEFIVGPNAVNIYRRPALKNRIKVDGNGTPTSIVQYEYAAGTGIAAYVEKDIFGYGVQQGVAQFKLHSRTGDPYYGECDYKSGLRLLSLNKSVLLLAEKWFNNSMISDLAIIMKGGDLQEEDKKKIRSLLKKQMTGVHNAYKVLFMEVGPKEDVKFERLGATLNETLFIKLRDSIREEQAAADGVAPRMAGIINGSGIGGNGEASSQLKQFELVFAKPRRGELQEWLQIQFDQAGLPDAETFKLNELDLTVAEQDALIYGPLIDRGVYTAEEVRAEMDMDKSISRMLKTAGLRKKIDYGV
ncbi:MAG: phage portal protein, partial [Ignavibacteriota bacterium]